MSEHRVPCLRSREVYVKMTYRLQCGTRVVEHWLLCRPRWLRNLLSGGYWFAKSHRCNNRRARSHCQNVSVYRKLSNRLHRLHRPIAGGTFRWHGTEKYEAVAGQSAFTDFSDLAFIVFTAQAYAREVLRVVILSVCPCVTRVDCDKTKWSTADIFIPHERAITLLLWH